MARFQNDVNTYETDAQADNAYLKSHQAKYTDVPDYYAVWTLTNNQRRLCAAGRLLPGCAQFSDRCSIMLRQPVRMPHRSPRPQPPASSPPSQDVAAAGAGAVLPVAESQSIFRHRHHPAKPRQSGQSTTTNVTFAGVLYKTPNAYEYADDDLRYNKAGHGGYSGRPDPPRSVYLPRELWLRWTGRRAADFRLSRTRPRCSSTTSRPMITNLNQMPRVPRAREAWSMTAHQTDLDLINYYGLAEHQGDRRLATRAEGAALLQWQAGRRQRWQAVRIRRDDRQSG